MSAQLNPYLPFQGQAREAMEFYQSVFGGDLTVTTFADLGGMGMPEDEQTLVMHSMLKGPDGLVLMGSDTPSVMEHVPSGGIVVSLSGEDTDVLTGWWDGLAEGGSVTMQLARAPWGDSFGTLTDRFGIPWMFNIAGA